VDLGCEQTNYDKVRSYFGGDLNASGKLVDWLTIQHCGGTRKTIEQGCSTVAARLREINRAVRTACPISSLVVGTECGASDSFSGITANPAIGSAVDRVIYGGGSAILSEIPEMVGTADMLLPRFRSRAVAQKFIDALAWYSEMARRLGTTLQDNLVPKNLEGGLINNFIKSLGAVMKGGTTPIEDVVDYGETLRVRGLTVMQGPGGDTESVTGLVASGANIICFSTGKGATTGDAICPVIKVSSTTELATQLPEDIDFDAGRLLTGPCGMDDVGAELFEQIVRVASGERTWSEKWKQRQFQIWTAGKLSL
jgi:altronate hydrolase